VIQREKFRGESVEILSSKSIPNHLLCLYIGSRLASSSAVGSIGNTIGRRALTDPFAFISFGRAQQSSAYCFTMIHSKGPSLLGLFLLLLSPLTTTFATASSPKERHERHFDSDEVTNGSMDMRLSARVDIPKFYVVLSPTNNALDDDEQVFILQSAEEMLDWSFQTAPEYEDGTSFDSLHLLGIKSWFVSGDEDGSRRKTLRRRSLVDMPERESNDQKGEDDTVVSSMPSHTVLEIEGGSAHFLVPANGKIPTTSMVASIVKNAVENDMLPDLQMHKMGGRNQIGGGPTPDFSSISSVRYIESINGDKDGQNGLDGDSPPTVDALVSNEDDGSASTDYAFTPIIVGIAIGGAMTVFVAVALVSRMTKNRKSLAETEFYPEDADTDSDLNASFDGKNRGMDFTHVITSEEVPPSPLNDFIARTSPSPNRKEKKSPLVGTGSPDTVIMDDGVSVLSSQDSMECQLSFPSTASVNGDLVSVARNLDETQFNTSSTGTAARGSTSTGRKKRKKSNLPPLDENTPYSVENYMVKNPALAVSISKDAIFDADAHWDPNDTDAGSVSSIDGNGFEEI